ncbi:pilus (MSHA type) biogenesis protein MshL [Helicobacter apodemus]|uniref:Pilus (MSHA type) biogenesis protein MshL n=1 Tax=Helicobacter apodemus TaxID=135569 RepID=A0A099UCA2_9HELI|nr:pilus (MSHA type) biogenesis protein MshL [Helicobacter apodemus]AWI34522.1 pilus (MSHA type) biogenesis protein MshL [Helicobacter apodemus]TLE16248.1 pilus (MSHA type) biogenesis protein MshL [Helicobacter apodemus]
MRFLWIICFCSIVYGNCENRLFNLSLEDASVKIIEVLNEFAKECYFSVIYKDLQTQKSLDKLLPLINFKQKNLDFVFDLLFGVANLHYTYENNLLTLQIEKIKTFKINYVGTNRQGSSSTSVFINNDENYANAYKDSMAQGLSKSGIDISSEDGFNFWDMIEEEILSLLNKTQKDSSVIVNRGAGLISVRADKESLQKVESYIQSLHQRLQKQVLIDVNILSISHNHNNTTGINWNELYNLQNFVIPSFTQNPNFGGSGEVGNVSGLNVVGGSGKDLVSYGINIFSQGLSLERIIEFLKTYGKVQSISNPKILTLNNQPAMISVGDILRYKKSSIYQNINAQTTLTNVGNEYPTIFAGVLLDVTPLVFGDEIMLKINPSITKTRENKLELPSNAFETPPNLTTNQLSSIVRVKNNQKIILGGLISQNISKKENKIPLLGDIPLLKTFFSYSQDIQNTEEIVFIIEPKIINEDWVFSLESLGYKLIEE